MYFTGLQGGRVSKISTCAKRFEKNLCNQETSLLKTALHNFLKGFYYFDLCPFVLAKYFRKKVYFFQEQRGLLLSILDWSHTCPKLVETTLKPSRKTLLRDDFCNIPDHKNVKFEIICNRPWKKI